MDAQTKLVGIILAKNIILIGLKNCREVNSMAIKIDMEMPKSCDKCKFKKSVGEWQWDCFLTGKIINCFIRDKYRRHPKCPLQEVKE